MRLMCKGKIHRATVTDANLNYVGSITIDKTLMLASDIREYEQVHVLNVNNGERFLTYAITGKADSGIICVNGAASRLVQPGDLVIILSYSWYKEEELAKFIPKHIHVNHKNKIKEHYFIEEEIVT